MFFVHFYDFSVHFSGWRGSGRVLEALLGAPQGGQGGGGSQNNVSKIFFFLFFPKVVFSLGVDSNV